MTEIRTIPAPAGEIWELICDPHHLPRWWPRVERVEGVVGNAFTEVLRSERGHIVRADFDVIRREDDRMRLLWAQQIAGTPFARVLSASETELCLSPVAALGAADQTEVRLTLTQTPPILLGSPSAPAPGVRGSTALSGVLARLGRPMISRAAAKTLKEALDGLERICC